MTGCQKKLSLLIFSIICTFISCATQKNNAQISFSKQGQSSEHTPEMVKACKQFQLSKADVIKFYLHSRQSDEIEIHDKYDILPCYSTGQMTLNNETLTWIIRAGGTGSFRSTKQPSLRVCDEQCCDLLKHVC